MSMLFCAVVHDPNLPPDSRNARSVVLPCARSAAGA